MSCKKKVYSLIKTGSAGVPEIVNQFYIENGVPVPIEDPTALASCPEQTLLVESVCFEINGEEPKKCYTGKCTIAVNFDCNAEEGSQYTQEIIGLIGSDGEIKVGKEEGLATIVDCPSVQLVAEDLCLTGLK